jgi:hypothetical protein
VKQIFVLAGFLFLTPLCALAQVTVNPAALQQLAGISAPPPPPVAMTAPVVVVVVHHWPHIRHPVVAVATAKLPPPVPVAARVVAPPTPKPAPTAPKPVANVTLVFAPGSADLPGNAATALKPFCTASGVVAVDARAPTDPSDPSAAMRLSLARAFAVRDALAACGLPAQNSLPRADGNVPGQNEDATAIGGGGAK